MSCQPDTTSSHHDLSLMLLSDDPACRPAVQLFTEPTIPCSSSWLIPADPVRPVDVAVVTAPLHPVEVASLLDTCAMLSAEETSGEALSPPPSAEGCPTREHPLSEPPPPAAGSTLPSMRAEALPAGTEALFAQIESAAEEVHGVLGPGLLEAAYAQCLAYELGQRGIRAEQHAALPIRYKGQHVAFAARLSLVVEQRIAVQIEPEAPDMGQEYRVRRLIDLAGLEAAMLLSFHGASMVGAARRIVRESILDREAREAMACTP